MNMSTTVSDLSSIESVAMNMRVNNGCCNKRRVCFSTEVDDIFYLRDVAPASTMTDEERDSAWYTNEDMIHMKEQAKTLARRLRSVAVTKTSLSKIVSDDDGTTTREETLKRRLDEEYPTNFPPQYSHAAAMEDNIDETYRGLELRIFLGRQLKKYIAARTVMEYQRRNKLKIAIAAKNGNPNITHLMEVASTNLGYVSAKCSRWARDIALVTGQSDFHAIHEQMDNTLSTSVLDQPKQYPLTNKRKTETFTSAGDFQMNMPRTKRMLNPQQPVRSFFGPIDGMRCDALPVNIF